MKYLAAKRIPVSGGYAPLQDEPFLKNTFETRGYQFAYGKNYFEKWRKRNDCPANRKACGEALWFTQNLLLAEPELIQKIDKTVESWARIR